MAELSNPNKWKKYAGDTQGIPTPLDGKYLKAPTTIVTGKQLMMSM